MNDGCQVIRINRKAWLLKAETTIDRRAYIVDDNEAFRTTVRRMLTSAGIYCEEFVSAEALLAGQSYRAPGCVLLDVRLPGMSGLDLLLRLKQEPLGNPIIMMSGHGDIPTAVSAVKAGAMDFIQKPFRKDDLLFVVENGFELLRKHQESPANRLDSLSRREQQVLIAFADGVPNKVVANRLNLSLRTVEMHRANMYKKLGVDNLTQALFMAKERGLVE